MIVGIDEAGRGPVCGPLVYGIAWMPAEVYQTGILEKLGVTDSKALSANTREHIYNRLQDLPKEDFGCNTAIVSADQISRAMLAPHKTSLNLLSFEAARSLLYQLFISHEIEHVYIDLVGPESQYAAYIRELMPSIALTICAKADAKYPITGAASIVAKVIRDRNIKPQWGSGYPSDPKTKKYLDKTCHGIYGFPTHIRHSWETIKRIYDTASKCVKCVFIADTPLENGADMPTLESLGIATDA
ncbi:Ribonuclease HI, large sub [Giardia duodenalis]|uniref:Ribonuclease n=1 Tax=Giardia intestinalis (strain ATCC 50803 / WB clone C6) TaxID=184922 RepID=A8B5I7_GIAIC|nr:Ribonuclease HI, large sub [Giardia intestinalis]KAE8305168.1 Ribonuclease HI, large sub [Giardia intestinalis]|eukprot:XP_001709231.1 Ribonuclease HI, large sub [Giardia lamblia ATCC 50803]